MESGTLKANQFIYIDSKVVLYPEKRETRQSPLYCGMETGIDPARY